MNLDSERDRYEQWFASRPEQGQRTIAALQDWRKYVNDMPGAVPAGEAFELFSSLDSNDKRRECMRAWVIAQARGDWSAWGNFIDRLTAKKNARAATE